jgi:hypothetical protein
MRWTIAALCFLAACRHQPQSYTLKMEGRMQVLAPPVSKPQIKSARKHPRVKMGCDIDTEPFAVEWHGNTAKIAVKVETYYVTPPMSRAQGADPTVSIAATGERMDVDSLTQMEAFREALAAKQDSGCFRDEEAARLRETIAETFPFPPSIAVYLRFGTYPRTGFVDLMPGFVLRLVSPAGVDPDVSFYSVTRAAGDRTRIALASGAGKVLTVPEAPAYVRYRYWTGASAHNFRTTILGAPGRRMLRDATSQFLADPEKFCEKPGEGIFCQSVAVTVGMNAGFYVRVNGRDIFTRIGGTVGEALGDAQNGLREVGRRQALPQNVTVRRMYLGKLIPVKVDGSANIASL